MIRIHDRPPQEHGGNLIDALKKFGSSLSDWLDLSTGINPTAYPLPKFSQTDWARLPDSSLLAAATQAAAKAYRVPKNMAVTLVPGASAAIARLPLLCAQPVGMASNQPVTLPKIGILSPTYNEYENSFRNFGYSVQTYSALPLSSESIAPWLVVVNPNNPDGRLWCPQKLLSLSSPSQGLIIDESFGDLYPKYSAVPFLSGAENTLILRSFGKFYGLAGIRLGAIISGSKMAENFRRLLGPWPISAPALRIALQAWQDHDWADQMRHQLQQMRIEMDAVLQQSSVTILGGTDLFRLISVKDSLRAQEALAAHKIWTRRFSYQPQWLRLGLPRLEELPRLANALRSEAFLQATQ